MIQFLKSLFQRKQPRLPTVPGRIPTVAQFIAWDGVQVGDLMRDNKARHWTVYRVTDSKLFPLLVYILDENRALHNRLNKLGWFGTIEWGERYEHHIVRVVRDGKIVAQGRNTPKALTPADT